MKKVEVKVVGKRPLLFHKFNIDVISDTKKVKSGKAGDNPEEWKETVLQKDGQLYIPGIYWFSCMREGSKYTKKKMGSIQKEFTSCTLVLSDISLLDRHLPDGWEKMKAADMPLEPTNKVYLDIRGVMNPNSKGRNVRYRVACAPGWKTTYSFTFDDTIISQSQVTKVVEDSGKLVGVGDARILGFGRYDIEDCQITDHEE